MRGVCSGSNCGRKKLRKVHEGWKYKLQVVFSTGLLAECLALRFESKQPISISADIKLVMYYFLHHVKKYGL